MSLKLKEFRVPNRKFKIEMGFRKSKTKRELKSRIKKDFEILNKKRGRKVRIEIGQNLSIGDWVLCKRGLDGDNSYLKFLFKIPI